MPQVTIVKSADNRVLDRGSGIKTLPLITPHSTNNAAFTTGISTYPQGKGAPFHSHNCDEQVTLLEGKGEVEINGEITPLVKYDTTYIPGDLVHAFRNTGDEPMVILWVYASNRVTRRFAGSDEDVEHLSAADMMGAKPVED
ncbi:MAG: cupin domain-containing protein [Spongiibacteraceae bacterium]|nr:cupin domain-containing protein [Spongiibacteraceae bacterium]